MVSPSLLNRELLLETPGTRRSTEFAQAEGRRLSHERIGIPEHDLQNGPYLSRPSAKLGHARAGYGLVALLDGLDQLRANL